MWFSATSGPCERGHATAVLRYTANVYKLLSKQSQIYVFE